MIYWLYVLHWNLIGKKRENRKNWRIFRRKKHMRMLIIALYWSKQGLELFSLFFSLVKESNFQKNNLNWEKMPPKYLISLLFTKHGSSARRIPEAYLKSLEQWKKPILYSLISYSWIKIIFGINILLLIIHLYRLYVSVVQIAKKYGHFCVKHPKDFTKSDEPSKKQCIHY